MSDDFWSIAEAVYLDAPAVPDDERFNPDGTRIEYDERVFTLRWGDSYRRAIQGLR